MPSKYLEPLLKQLALEYNCAPGDFLRPDNIVTQSCLRENRRHYSDEKPFFHMATLGQNAVITADRKLHPFLRIFAREKGRALFEFPSLLPLERELSQYGYTLMSSFHMFLPKHDVRPESRYPVQWFYGEAIHPFYDKAGFENALNGKNCARPDRIGRMRPGWHGHHGNGPAAPRMRRVAADRRGCHARLPFPRRGHLSCCLAEKRNYRPRRNPFLRHQPIQLSLLEYRDQQRLLSRLGGNRSEEKAAFLGKEKARRPRPQ